MATIRIETNLPGLGRGLEKIFKRFPNVMDKRFGAAAKRTQVLLFRKSPKVTNRLALGWFTKRIRRFVWEVDNDVKYTDAVEFGTGLFNTRGRRARIFPKRKKFLKFLDRGQPYNLRKTNFGGGPFFFLARSIRGQKPQFIAKNSFPLARRILTLEILKGLKIIAKGINRLKTSGK